MTWGRENGLQSYCIIIVHSAHMRDTAKIIESYNYMAEFNNAELAQSELLASFQNLIHKSIYILQMNLIPVLQDLTLPL